MGQNFFLDPAALAKLTESMREAGTLLSGAQRKLIETLEKHHGCWGTDETGEAFGKSYAPQEEQFKPSTDQAADTYPSLAVDMDKSSDVFQNVDEDNARAIDRRSGTG